MSYWDPLAAAGNVTASVAQVGWAAVEKGVEVSGVGKAAEAVGITVKADVFENGIDGKVKMGEYEQVFGAKGKSSGGDFGADGKTTVKIGDKTIAKGEASVDQKGVHAAAEVGVHIDVDWMEIKSCKDFNKLGAATGKQLVERTPGLNNIDEALKNVFNFGIEDAAEKMTELAITNSPVSFAVNAFFLLIKDIDEIKTYGRVGGFIGVEAEATAQFKKKKQVKSKKGGNKNFFTTSTSLKAGVGIRYAFAYSAVGETTLFGHDMGVMFSCSGAMPGCVMEAQFFIGFTLPPKLKKVQDHWELLQHYLEGENKSDKKKGTKKAVKEEEEETKDGPKKAASSKAATKSTTSAAKSETQPAIPKKPAKKKKTKPQSKQPAKKTEKPKPDTKKK